jgi:HD-GYP domain-containing protein (c-di-GMP phosphodiesterase class II)
VGDEIPLLAQIVGVVDAFDAMTTTRPYRAALAIEAACAELQRDVARGWRRHDLVDTFIALPLRRQPPSATSMPAPRMLKAASRTAWQRRRVS